MSLQVVISGPRGKMGSQVYQKLKEDGISIVAILDYKENSDKREPVYNNAEKCFSEVKADVFIDFTNPKASSPYILSALNNGVKVVSGTTGFSNSQLEEFRSLANEKNVACIICPNFAIGAVFMMIFSQYAANYFNHINIIEKHHEEKFDVPSGTAHTIQQLIRENNEKVVPEIFSVRSPGFVAHHEVIFGGPGQIFSIKHDSFNRDSFLDGLMLALREIDHINEYIFGLENVLRL